MNSQKSFAALQKDDLTTQMAKSMIGKYQNKPQILSGRISMVKSSNHDI